MTPRLSQGCTWVLLLAMMLAIAAGLMAWGPVHFPLVPPGDLPARLPGTATPLDALSCLPLLVVGAWSAWVVLRDRWPRALRMPWFAFFVSSALSAAASALFHLQPSALVHAAGHAFGATAMTMLALAFAAERMDVGFGSRRAVASAGAIAGVAALWWLAGHWASGHGDLRALLFLECLPLLLLPAGALSLPGHFTRAGDWGFMLFGYVAARALGLLDASLGGAGAGFGGHALMHLLLAGVVAWPLYRMAAASRRGDAPAASPPEPTQRRTSLNTSS